MVPFSTCLKDRVFWECRGHTDHLDHLGTSKRERGSPCYSGATRFLLRFMSQIFVSALQPVITDAGRTGG